MQPQNVKKILIQKLKDSLQTTQVFYQGLNEEERSRLGELKNWQARDIVIHFIEWNKLLNKALRAILNQETPHLEEDYLAYNDQMYLDKHEQSWEDTLTDAAAVTEEARQIVQAFTPEALLDPNYHPIFKGAPITSQIMGYYITHPAYHLADYDLKNGRGDAAIQRLQQITEEISQYDESPRSKASSLYNVACFYCMMDKLDQALDTLEQAFPDAPDLKSWARKDGDLSKLHENERFLSMTETKNE
jgi:tetratricopeptide (TPR) repeat protein